MVEIKTEFVYPPIPIRCFDWCAWFDGQEEGPTGKGETEAEAIENLLEQKENYIEVYSGLLRGLGKQKHYVGRIRG